MVLLDVQYQVLFLFVAFIASCSFVRLFIFVVMNFQVLCKIPVLREPSAALGADKRLLAGVRSEVVEQVPRLHELPAAAFEGSPERSLLLVGFFGLLVDDLEVVAVGRVVVLALEVVLLDLHLLLRHLHPFGVGESFYHLQIVLPFAQDPGIFDVRILRLVENHLFERLEVVNWIDDDRLHSWNRQCWLSSLITDHCFKSEKSCILPSFRKFKLADFCITQESKFSQ